MKPVSLAGEGDCFPCHVKDCDLITYLNIWCQALWVMTAVAEDTSSLWGVTVIARPWCQVLLQGHSEVLEIPMSLLQLGKEMNSKAACFMYSSAVLLLQYPSNV